MRFLFRSLMGLFLTFLTLGLLFLAGVHLWRLSTAPDGPGRPGDGRAEQVYTARLLTVKPQPVTPRMKVYGTVEARRRLELRAGASGQIVFLDPQMLEGGTVTAGQLLVRIDPAAAQAALDNQIAARDDAEATLRDAQRNVLVAADDLAAAERQAELRHAAVSRQESLAERGLGTSAEREASQLAASAAEQAVIAGRSALAAAESAVTAARNALRRAEIDLSEARRALADTEIRADFSGRVTDVTAVQGGLVSLNEQLAEIIDPKVLEVKAPCLWISFPVFPGRMAASRAACDRGAGWLGRASDGDGAAGSRRRLGCRGHDRAGHLCQHHKWRRNNAARRFRQSRDPRTGSGKRRHPARDGHRGRWFGAGHGAGGTADRSFRHGSEATGRRCDHRGHGRSA